MYWSMLRELIEGLFADARLWPLIDGLLFPLLKSNLTEAALPLERMDDIGFDLR